MTKGEIASKEPIGVDVEEGKTYFWCSCGKSSKQPFCDGSHKGSEFSPVAWEAKASEKKYFCACKQTDNAPFCDGSHNAIDAKDDAPLIEQRENGPLVVKNVDNFKDYDDSAIDAKPVMALCRCGKSANKPFCDGAHANAGFKSERETETPQGRVYSYEGGDVTVYYNKILCSHSGECGRLNHAVFDPSKRPWIQPDNSAIEAISDVIAACPSGALSYSVKGAEATHLDSDEVGIKVERNGPYWVKNIEIKDVVKGDRSSDKKYVLCRCGLSTNKPFCDGSHYDAKWRDDA